MSRVHGSRHRLVLAAALMALVTLLTLTFAARVSAHVEYDSSEPPADSVQTVAPTTVSVNFTGEIGQNGSVLEVYGPDGSRVDNNDLQLNLYDLDRRELTVTLRADLPDGEYRVRVGGASIDGHEPEIQEFGFTIAAGGGAGTPAVATPGAATPGVGTPAATPIAAFAAQDGAVSDEGTNALPLAAFLLMAVVAAIPFVVIAVRNRRSAN